MIRFLLMRLSESILLILGVLILVFFMVRVTGDPVALMVSRQATQEQREAFREALGLNRPLGEQLISYLSGVARGDLGRSLSRGISNLELIAQRLPATFELALASLGLALAVALPLGIAAGMRPDSLAAGAARLLGLAGQTIPTFWLAMMLIIVFAVQLRLLPSFGRDSIQSLILPAVALSFGTMGQMVRLTYSVILEIRSENYIRTAHAKGLSSRAIATRHVLRNAAVPLISVIGINFTYLLGGSVYIESIFAWPGLGSLLQQAIGDNDFPLVQAITIFISLFAIGVNLLTNLIYGWVDPRVRGSGS